MSEDCVCYYDGPMPSVFRTKEQKARREYRCLECNTLIPVGQTYVYIFGVWEGYADTFRLCKLCNDLRQRCDLRCTCYGELEDALYWYTPESDGVDMEVEAFWWRRFPAQGPPKLPVDVEQL